MKAKKPTKRRRRGRLGLLPPSTAFLLDLPFLLLTLCFSASRSNAQGGLCPAGWEIGPSKDKCFGFFAKSYSWDESEAFCSGYHGHLAALTSAQELDFVQKRCIDTTNGCWVGGRRFNSSAGFSWKWSDDISQWNESVFPGKPFSVDCTTQTCPVANSSESCTLVISGHVALVGQSCKNSHEFICMRNIDDNCYHKRCHQEYFIILAAVSGLILLTMSAIVFWLLAYRRSKKKRRSHRVSSPSAAALVPPSWKVFTSDELRRITKNFSEGNKLLGDAKTGGTFSGLLPDGCRVAVKRLKRSSFQRKKEFYSEIRRISRLHHPNLVTVKGCCYDHGDRFIVYEFVANGPLDRWLYHIPRGGRSLDWMTRMKIVVTLAQGIAFLHDKVKPHVVHRDIRASNVLLDEEFGAHLMGVGLSKFVPWEVMHERTVMAGSHGYLAPEFVYRNELTTKSDVYSFGVLLLEIVSGRRPAQAVDSVGWQSIFEWATPLVQSHRYVELLDPVISDIPEVGVIQKVVDLVYACTQHVPSVRPRMSFVVHQLQQLGPRESNPEEGRSSPTTCIQ
ncbi:unnamed protein product [Victoria cruziana]